MHTMIYTVFCRTNPLRPIPSRLALLLLAVTLTLPAGLTHGATTNGIGLYRDLGQDMFLAALKLDTASASPESILASSSSKSIEIRFIEQMPARRWRNFWTQSIAINNSRDALLDAADDLSDMLAAIKGPLMPGDQVEITFDMARGTAISVNDTELSRHPDTHVFNLFLSALIGPVPPSREFRQSLLGLEDTSDYHQQFEALSPDPERTQVITRWITPEPEAEAEPEQQLASTEQSPEQVPDLPPEPQPEQPEAPASQMASPEPEPGTGGPATSAEPQLAQEPDSSEPATPDSSSTPTATPPTSVAQDAPGDTETASDDEGSDITVEALLAQQEYLTHVIRQIYSQVSYPESAINRGHEDSIRALIYLNRDGSLHELTLAQESRYNALNRAVIQAINKAAPFPPVPDSLRPEPVELVIPVSFQLTR